MCAINGIIQFHNHFDSQKMKQIVHTMNNQVIHRGPDDEGLFSDFHCGLGMRRLAIIDLGGATANME